MRSLAGPHSVSTSSSCPFAAVCAILALWLTAVLPVQAHWCGDPALNNAVCTETVSNQRTPMACTDGAGGMIVVWSDDRAGVRDIYAQKVDADGVCCWASGGALVNASAANKTPQGIVSDGTGGAIVVFSDGFSGYVFAFAQRVGPDGTTVWPDRVPLSSTYTNGGVPVSNGAGGALIIYQTNGSPRRVYVQQVMADGTLPWGADGVSVSTNANDQFGGGVCSDGAGGALAGFVQNVGSGVENWYAQRVVAAGTRQWGDNGVVVDAAGSSHNGGGVLPDGTGGAFMMFGRVSGTIDLYAQRLNSDGVAQWTTNGVPVCTATNNQYLGPMAPDGTGGFVTTWSDVRNGASNPYWIYMQRLDGSGVPQWTTDGVPVRTTMGISLPVVVAQTWDGSTGWVMAWHDNYPLSSSPTQVYVQRMNPDGTPAWAPTGVQISTAANTRVEPRLVIAGSGTVLAVWQDYRSGTQNDIYASRLLPDGTIPVTLSGFSLE